MMICRFYSIRGAKVSNMQAFIRDLMPRAIEVRVKLMLYTNYFAVGCKIRLLVITVSGMGKNLWDAKNTHVDKIRLYEGWY